MVQKPALNTASHHGFQPFFTKAETASASCSSSRARSHDMWEKTSHADEKGRAIIAAFNFALSALPDNRASSAGGSDIRTLRITLVTRLFMLATSKFITPQGHCRLVE